MMNINLSNIFARDENVFYFEEEINDSEVNEDLKEFEVLHPIIYKGQISRVNMEYILDVDIYVTFKTDCDRCLTPTEKEIKVSLSAVLKDSSSKYLEQDDSDTEDKSPEDDGNIIYYENNKFDIEKYVIMQVLSSLPMKTLCDEECKGLCPQCGIDLNKETCDCVIDDTDPRLEKLKDFLVDE